MKWHYLNLFFQQQLVDRTSKCHTPFLWQAVCREIFALAGYCVLQQLMHVLF